MSHLQTRPRIDTWISASWDEYLRTLEDPIYKQAKGYYYKGHMRIEMSPVSFDHGKDHVVLIFAVSLFTALKGIPATGLDTTTLRKKEMRECQPDVSYYLGDRSQAIPSGTGIVNLDQYPAPNLVIEVAKSSLLDDVGTKRALYEELGVSEYWVVDVQNAQLLAYAIADQGSKQIQVSQVLPGLLLAVLEEALRRSRETNQSQMGA
ncbi:MAG: Uma2 family endonuclease, partial [Leptolyngbyaceae bacterium]|nr:Uma2 family endonuclease [Leptolyngbyaceae bacterium]